LLIPEPSPAPSAASANLVAPFFARHFGPASHFICIDNTQALPQAAASIAAGVIRKMPSFRISKLQLLFFGFAHLNYHCKSVTSVWTGVAAWNRGVLARTAEDNCFVPAGPVPSPFVEKEMHRAGIESMRLRTTRKSERMCYLPYLPVYPSSSYTCAMLLTRSSAAHNEEQFIGEMIASVMRQTPRPAKWIIVDDVPRMELGRHPVLNVDGMIEVIRLPPKNASTRREALSRAPLTA